MRTDIHTETNLRPEDYVYIRYFYGKQPLFVPWTGFSIETYDMLVEGWRKEQAELRELTAGSPYLSTGQCDHCGARFAHGALIKHIPTGQHLTIGCDCADGRFGMSQAEYDRFRETKKQAAARSRLGRARQLLAWRREQPELLRLLNKGRDDEFLGSLRRQLCDKGELSERQIEAGLKAGRSKSEWISKRDAERAQLEATGEPVIAGRQQITATVLAIKSQDTEFGIVWKLLVQLWGGSKLWGTQPASLDGANRGDRVTFTAAVEPSADDPFFGYYKRPTKAYILSRANPTV